MTHPFYKCPGKGKPRCHRCKEIGHLIAECPVKPGKTCFVCASFTHLKNECPIVVDEPCDTCGRTDHPRYECPDTSSMIHKEENPVSYGTEMKLIDEEAEEDWDHHEDYDWLSEWFAEFEYDDSAQVQPFRGSKSTYSNWYKVPGGLRYKDERHTTLEHAYKSEEAKYAGRYDLVMKLKTVKSGYEAMVLVNTELKGVTNNAWNRDKVEVMYELLQEKAEQCPIFRDSLILSGSDILVEATRNEEWGSGLDGVNPTLDMKPSKWPGANQLGKLLMRVRSEVFQEEAERCSDEEDDLESQVESVEDSNDESGAIEAIESTTAREGAAVKDTAVAAVTKTPNIDAKNSDDKSAEIEGIAQREKDIQVGKVAEIKVTGPATSTPSGVNTSGSRRRIIPHAISPPVGERSSKHLFILPR